VQLRAATVTSVYIADTSDGFKRHDVKPRTTQGWGSSLAANMCSKNGFALISHAGWDVPCAFQPATYSAYNAHVNIPLELNDTRLQLSIHRMHDSKANRPIAIPIRSNHYDTIARYFIKVCFLLTFRHLPLDCHTDTEHPSLW
jgi:hypothetical protein